MGCSCSRPEDTVSDLSPSPQATDESTQRENEVETRRSEGNVGEVSPPPASSVPEAVDRASTTVAKKNSDQGGKKSEQKEATADSSAAKEDSGQGGDEKSEQKEATADSSSAKEDSDQGGDEETEQKEATADVSSAKAKEDSDQGGDEESEQKEATAGFETWTRLNIMALYDGQPYSPHDDQQRIQNWAECDRIFIAFHRLQTKGRVAYRRLLGMHGGGGGTNDDGFRIILKAKMEKDIETHYNGKAPDNGTWPNPVPNCPPPKPYNKDDDNYCFVYTFCWHAEPEFIMWHRPLMAEFERMLQEYDPKEVGHNKKDSLGAPYWSWEGWDGLTLPQVIDNPFYVVKTNKWEDKGFPKGSIFPNPYHRWFAPVSVEDQIAEKFPDILNDHNTTKRASAFHDSGSNFDYPWELVSHGKNLPSMKEVVATALSNPCWYHFCTMNAHVGGGNYSIENAHNKFHNHVGGLVMGGVEGSGVQDSTVVQQTKEGDEEIVEFTGTMTQNQSIFDPIFFLHHSNVERQLCSWQRTFADSKLKDVTLPDSKMMKRVLYPWTKPHLLWDDGKFSHNTESNQDNDATFKDWWDHKHLRYVYDEYLRTETVKMPKEPFMKPKDFVCRVKISFDASKYKGGEYALVLRDGERQRLLGTISVLVGGGACARCASRAKGVISYKVHAWDGACFSDINGAKEAMKKENLHFTRNGKEIVILEVHVDDWEKAEDRKMRGK